jgi:hypothetical protein
MDPDLITLAEAAHRLDLDRSNVLRRARRGDFGEITEIGRGDGRPSLILVSAAAINAFAAQRTA